MTDSDVVMRLPSKVIQIQTIAIPASINNGDFVELVALCEDGSMWIQFHSNGYANVPTDNQWRMLHPAHESEYWNRQISPL